ncbi:MAG: haloacid dehalogenase-like hydrolase [bacterium]|nr:haloacid dehalogenase-like hydrolase [bacterium]
MRLVTVILVLLVACTAQADPLSAWNDSQVKTAITDWLAAVTDESGPDFVPVPERIAVFDNDGTCWNERPRYASTMFQVNLARSMVAVGKADPEAMPFKAWFAGDRAALKDYGWTKAYEDMNASFAGMPVTAYRDSARAWMARTRHERYGVTHDQLYYVPMLQLVRLLEAHDFQVWIVTGAAQDFVRAWSEPVVGVPPERVIGSYTTPVYEEAEDGTVTMVRGAAQFDNGHENKPPHIEQRIGRRPVFAAGNSNNDYYMMNYAVTGDHRGLAIWIHHDDGKREYDYGRPGKIGGLCHENPRAYEVSMKRDWQELYADEFE